MKTRQIETDFYLYACLWNNLIWMVYFTKKWIHDERTLNRYILYLLYYMWSLCFHAHEEILVNKAKYVLEILEFREYKRGLVSFFTHSRRTKIKWFYIVLCYSILIIKITRRLNTDADLTGIKIKTKSPHKGNK